MTHTTNYNLNLPAGTDPAAITPLNQNFTLIDTYLKSNLNQMAADYDSTETYNTDDIVAHDNAIYKCLDDGVTGTWDSTKWEATTLGKEVGQGGGGSSVVVNPSGDQDEVLDGIEVDGTNYGLDVVGEISDVAIASFSDGANLPINKCIVDVTATQDLHGYDHPWAGGAGKNKLQVTATTATINGILFTVNVDGSITANNVSKISGASIFVVGNVRLSAGIYILNGSVLGAGGTYYIDVSLTEQGVSLAYSGNGDVTFTLESDATVYCRCVVASAGLSRVGDSTTFYPMIRLSTVSDATFEPYSNICPISGWSEANLWIQTTVDPTADPTATADFNTTIYGGRANLLTGEGVITHGNIASYNGETLPSTWISDRDVYTEGGTPTTGAQVVYELATPQTFTFDPIPTTNTLEGVNNVYADCGDINTLGYFKDGKLTRSVKAIVEAMTGNVNTILADAIGEE